jgi:hypothetical protein
LNKISEAKVNLENEHYQKGIYVLCDIDTQKSQHRRQLEAKVAEVKRHLIVCGGKAFDCCEAYPRYSIGAREFMVQKVNIVQRNNDFVMVD